MLLEPGAHSRDRSSPSPRPEAVQQAMASMSGIQGQESTMQVAFCPGSRICAGSGHAVRVRCGMRAVPQHVGRGESC